MLKKVVLLNIFVKTDTFFLIFFFRFFDEEKVQKNTIIFIDTFDQFNVSLLN